MRCFGARGQWNTRRVVFTFATGPWKAGEQRSHALIPGIAMFSSLVQFTDLQLFMSSNEVLAQVKGLFNGKRPDPSFHSGIVAQELADALSARIDAGVAPSLCAHSMCCSAVCGIVPVVKMLAARPASVFNKAYNFGEPLRRACRAFVRETDPTRQRDLAECAKILVHAKAGLDSPDKYLKSGMSAAGSLKACGSVKALELLSELRAIQQHNDESDRDKSNVDKGIKASSAKRKIAVSAEVENDKAIVGKPQPQLENEAKKRKR
jgi:hypothetical protein